MQQSSATPKNQDVGIELRKIVACSQSSSQCLLVSTVFYTVSSLHPTSFLYRRSYTHVRMRMRIATICATICAPAPVSASPTEVVTYILCVIQL